jgi:hypothetical protein
VINHKQRCSVGFGKLLQNFFSDHGNLFSIGIFGTTYSV